MGPTLLCYAIFSAKQHLPTDSSHVLRLIGLPVYDTVVIAGKIGTVASVMRHILLQYTAWDNPLRVDLHPLNITGKQRCLGSSCATGNAHGDNAVRTTSIEMKRGNVDHHMFDTMIDWPVLSPSCTLHITDNSLAVFFCSGSLQHRRQLSVIVGSRLNIAQKGINAVVTYFLHNCPYGIMVRAVDVNIKKFPINGDSPERVLLIDIQMVEDTMGLNKTVAQA